MMINIDYNISQHYIKFK